MLENTLAIYYLTNNNTYLNVINNILPRFQDIYEICKLSKKYKYMNFINDNTTIEIKIIMKNKM